MFRASLTALLLGLAAPLCVQVAAAQAPGADACAHPDSIVARGNTHVSAVSIVSDAGLTLGDTLSYRDLQRAIRNVYANGAFADVRISCQLDSAATHAKLVIQVRERPTLADVQVAGVNAISERSVKDRVDLLIGRPIDPSQVTRVVARIDSLYEAQGYYLARVRADTTMVSDDRAKITFHIDEGRRLAISGIDIEGNKRLSDKDVVSAMKTRPEGFWFFRRGEFDEDKFAIDLGDRIPKRYAASGFVDFQILKDTLIVDRERGKGLVKINVDEGPQYHIGSFEVVGNHRFTTEEIARFFPFTREEPSIGQRVKGLLGRGPKSANVFDENAWEEATQRVRTAYSNEGYIQVRVRPVVERVNAPEEVASDSTKDSATTRVADASRDGTHDGAGAEPRVNLRWEIDEGSPATINRIDIIGNDYTTESCIRDALVMVPGDVFNYDRLIRSYQQIANMGFFEAPMPQPDIKPANDKGDVDIVFTVKEKRTGSVNFGASLGQGTGVGGFLGLEQPNVLGQCKRVSLNWQFGRYINDFQISYTDPSIRQSWISGTVTAYNTRSRFVVADLGRQTRTGGSLQFGFPIPGSPLTRLFLSYGGEAVKSSGGVFERDTISSELCTTTRCFRSSVGATLTHDTRIDMPFASAGGMQTVTAAFNGGPLGGSANFQRYTAEMRAYAPLGQFGGSKPGSQPAKFVMGLTSRAGAVFGNAGPFFVTQKFALGGTQFGEMLRGYEEFSIAPRGFVTGTDNFNARPESFGNAFFTTTAEVGLRVNQMFYTNLFFDAGNIWDRPREFDPTRLFRGAGIGVALVTPLGPLGLDWAYGFDRLNALGQKDPKWQLHFRLGNIF